MKKIIATIIVAVIMLIGCSKTSSTEPIIGNPDTTGTDTTHVNPNGWQYNIKCKTASIRSDFNLYLKLASEPDTTNFYRNIICDSIRIVKYKDRKNFSLFYYPISGGKIKLENSGMTYLFLTNFKKQ